MEVPLEPYLSIESIVFFALALPCVVFFSLSNRVLSDLGVIRARRMLEDGQHIFEPFVAHSERYLMAIYILEAFSVVAMFGFGHHWMHLYLETWAIWLILGALFLILDIIFVRLFDKMDSRHLASTVVFMMGPLSLLLAPLSALLAMPLRPFAPVNDKHYSDANHIEDELELMLDESKKQGGLENIKGRIMRSAIDFGDTTVREVMIPRTALTACSVDTTLVDAISICIEEGYSRLPVYEDSLDSIVGILYYKDLMRRLHELLSDPKARDTEPLEGLLRDAYFVPETNHINTVFEDFQREHVHMAIVIDEFGGTAGIVTLEDIIEEFFGEIQDEYDSEVNPIVPLDLENRRVLVDARTTIYEISELFDVDIQDDGNFDTIGGFVTCKLGRMGEVGDAVSAEGLDFIVREANERCILQVEVSRTEDTSSEAIEAKVEE